MQTKPGSSYAPKCRSLQDIYEHSQIISQFQIPEKFEDAVKHHVWLTSMQEKIESIQSNDTWTLTSKPEGKEIVGLKWIYRIRIEETGKIQTYKSRLVAKGYVQQFGRDYTETYAHVARKETIRYIFAFAA